MALVSHPLEGVAFVAVHGMSHPLEGVAFVAVHGMSHPLEGVAFVAVNGSREPSIGRSCLCCSAWHSRTIHWKELPLLLCMA